jgi:hypothetical protein
VALIASTISRYSFCPATLYTLSASKKLDGVEFEAAMTGWLMPFGKLLRDVCDRYRCPLSSMENR